MMSVNSNQIRDHIQKASLGGNKAAQYLYCGKLKLPCPELN